jgi:Phosphotransferase enzyme family
VVALADRAWVNELLDDWCERRSEAPAGPWFREYARYHPGQNPWAVCLYQGEDGRLVRIEAVTSAEQAQVAPSRTGPLRITEFPDDPLLPSLGEVMSMLEHPRVIRYRPGQRCTLRGRALGSERFVQLIPGGERVYGDALALWAAQREGRLTFGVAEPYGWHEPTRSFWQGVVPGHSLTTELHGADGERFAHRVGAALGELAASNLQPVLSSPASEHLVHALHSMERAELALPALAPRLAGVRAALERSHAGLAARTPVPVHGAPNLHHWLLHGVKLGLVSFDRFTLGDPEFDIATVISELEAEPAPARPLAALEAAVIAGFESKALALDTQRFELFRVHKRLQNLLRTAWATRPDAAERAARQLGTIEVLLQRG